MIILLILVLCALISLGQVFLKTGLEKFGKLTPSDFFSRRIVEMIKEKNLVLGVILYAISTLLWLIILSRVELSFAYPLVALSYLFGVIFAKIFLGESISLLRWIGALIIILGVFFILKS